MRDVAVTEGDKVEAQLRFGVSVNTYGVNDLVAVVDAGRRRRRRRARHRVRRRYAVAPELRPAAHAHDSLRVRRPDRARPAGVPHRGRLRRLHHELRGPRRAAPAARARRAAADGRRLRLRRRGRLEDVGRCCGQRRSWPPDCRAARRSWRTTRTTWCPGRRRSSARTCSRSARPSPRPADAGDPPASIGGREDPVRLVFAADPGPAVVVGLSDLGDRFRLTANEIDVVEPDAAAAAPARRPRGVEAAAACRPRPRPG